MPSKDMNNKQNIDLYRIVEEDLRDIDNITLTIQVIGTSKTFSAKVEELFKKNVLDRFSREDVSYITLLYFSKKENNPSIIKNYPRKNFYPKKNILFISILYSTFLVLSNLSATKIMNFFDFALASGIIFFPLTYIFDDILTEVYGFKTSRRIIWYGLFASLITTLGIYIVSLLPPSPYWNKQECFTSIFDVSFKIFLASAISYLIGEFVNSYILAKLKILTQGKYFALRAISSTAVGVALENIIFCFIAFYGVLSNIVIIKMITLQYCFKLSYEILSIPLTQRIVNYLKKSDRIDHYDFNTVFNPFSLSMEDENEKSNSTC